MLGEALGHGLAVGGEGTHGLRPAEVEGGTAGAEGGGVEGQPVEVLVQLPEREALGGGPGGEPVVAGSDGQAGEVGRGLAYFSGEGFLEVAQFVAVRPAVAAVGGAGEGLACARRPRSELCSRAAHFTSADVVEHICALSGGRIGVEEVVTMACVARSRRQIATTVTLPMSAVSAPRSSGSPVKRRTRVPNFSAVAATIASTVLSLLARPSSSPAERPIWGVTTSWLVPDSTEYIRASRR